MADVAWAEKRKDLLVLSAMGVLAHGALLLNDGVYWDGWVVYWMEHTGHWDKLRELFVGAGNPPTYFIHRVIGAFGGAVPYKWAAFVCILGTVGFTYDALVESKLLTRLESLMACAVMLTLPVYASSVEMIQTPVLVYIFSFAIGSWAAVKFELTGKAGFRAAALAFLIFGLFLKSLVMFVLLPVFAAFLVARRKGVGVVPFGIRHADYLLLPFVHWFATKKLFPVSGWYADYNQIHGSSTAKIPQLFKFAEIVSFEELDAAATMALAAPFVTVLVVLGARWMMKKLGCAELPVSVRPLPLALIALGALTLAIFPYVAVGKVVALEGWENRHGLLCALPIGLLLVALLRVVAPGERAPGWLLATFGTLVFFLGVSNAQAYFGWEARWVKDRAIVQKLEAAAPGDRAYSVYWVDDRYPLGGEERYRFYEWASLFKTAWGNEAHVGIDQREPEILKTKRDRFTADRQLSELNPDGCQTHLTVERGEEKAGPVALSLHYWVDRYLLRSRLHEFLDSVVAVRIDTPACPPAGG